MGNCDIIKAADMNVVSLAADTDAFKKILQGYGLPSENVLASTSEREIVCGNFLPFFSQLSTEEKSTARYLSKFVGAAAIGLFDAALNYIWNEVVLNLRAKAVRYGIELFYDAAVGGSSRSNFRDDNDLDGLKDKVLLDTCYKLEIIPYVLYKKLEYILVMRNEIAASHPTMDRIGGYELMSFLQVCVTEVIQSPLSESAIQTKILLDSLKNEQTVVDETYIRHFEDEVGKLSIVHVNNLLVSICGIFCDVASSQIIRKNISRLAKTLWSASSKEAKYRIAARVDVYKTNLQLSRVKRMEAFLDIVDGHNFRQSNSKEIELNSLCERLESAHIGWDNFSNEPPVMREILKFCKSYDEIPEGVKKNLVRVVLRCRLGRGVSYCEGVSPLGRPLYDQFLSLLTDEGMKFLIVAVFSSRIKAVLSNIRCRSHLQDVLEVQKNRVVTPRLKDVFQFMISNIAGIEKLDENQDFIALVKPYATFTNSK